MKEALENELRELSPLLADMKKGQAGDPFKTPKFYFDNLADKVLAQANSAEKTAGVATKGSPQYKTFFEHLNSLFASIFQQKLALALASLALIVAASWYALTRKTPEIGTNTPQIAVNKSPYEPIIAPNSEPKTIELTQKKIVLKDVPNEEIDTYINDNLTDLASVLDAENAPKLADTEKSKLTHPQSGLTEEELETYLIDNAEEGDLDGSDNNF
jgi:hypothetical protein